MAVKDNSGTAVPQHVGIIMDGNGRWAKKRGLPRKFGHREGAKTFRSITRECKRLGIKYVTYYAFSTENWSRPADEVEAIMDLFEKYLDEVKDFVECGLCGTAAVISPVGMISDHGKEIYLPSGMEQMGPVTKKLYDTFRGIQLGTAPSPEGWLREIRL